MKSINIKIRFRKLKMLMKIGEISEEMALEGGKFLKLHDFFVIKKETNSIPPCMTTWTKVTN
jgi:hypothetical protein